MKKISLFLFFILVGVLLFPGNVLKLGPYAGYFSPADKNLKEIYGEYHLIYGMQMGIRVWNGFHFWLTGMQFKKTAKTIPLGDPTTLTVTPLNLSLRYTFDLGVINPYLGGGYSYIFYKEESVIGDAKGEGKGYALDAGIEFRLSHGFIIDVGARYNRAAVNPSGPDVQLGGAQAGISFLVAI